jgi:hypothetical protein
VELIVAKFKILLFNQVVYQVPSLVLNQRRQMLRNKAILTSLASRIKSLRKTHQTQHNQRPKKMFQNMEKTSKFLSFLHYSNLNFSEMRTRNQLLNQNLDSQMEILSTLNIK